MLAMEADIIEVEVVIASEIQKEVVIQTTFAPDVSLVLEVEKEVSL